jgi:hypothetical protein
MTTTGRFDLTQWDEEVYDEVDGVKLQTVRLAKDFEGGISGTSTARLLQAFSPDGSAAYVGIERVAAEVDGRKGSFVLRHSAVGSAAGGSMSVDVVPGSGTGDLAGIGGTFTIERSPDGEHTYTFDYVLNDADLDAPAEYTAAHPVEMED